MTPLKLISIILCWLLAAPAWCRKNTWRFSMKTIILSLCFALAAAAQVPPGGSSNASRLRGMPPCSATVTTSCVPNADASGNVAVGGAVLGPDQQIDVKCSGDVTTTLQAAINALSAANGGIVRLSTGSCYSTAQITVPTDAASPVPHQKPLEIAGNGSHWSGIASPTNGGTILDLRYVGTTGKIKLLGLGRLTLRDLSIVNATSTDSLPFIYTTNTTLHVRGVSFIGSSTASPLQDAIVLGGRGAEADGTTDGYFQGYGTVIDSNYFDYIQRGVLFQKHANAVVVSNNSWWTNCAGSAALEDWDDASYALAGLTIVGNLIEMNGYTNGFSFKRAIGASILGNNFYDPGAGVTSFYAFGANATTNTVVLGYQDTATKPLCTGAGCPTFFRTTAAGEITLSDGTATGQGTLKVGRLEVKGNRIVLRNGTTGDDVFNFYSSSGHAVKAAPSQSDGTLALTDYAGNNVFVLTGGDGTLLVRNEKPTTGYTYMQFRGGEGQSAIPLARFMDLNAVTGTTINADGSITMNLLTGVGNGFACLDANGKIYRSATVCVP